MEITLNACFWCVVQTSIVAGLALLLALLFRGRFPQWTSGLLAGAAICSLLLAAVAFAPSVQWSLVDVRALGERMLNVGGQTLDLDGQPTKGMENLRLEGFDANSSRLATLPMQETEAVDGNEHEPDRDKLPTALQSHAGNESKSTQWILGNVAGWLCERMQSLDDNVRSYATDTSSSRANALMAARTVTIGVFIALAGLWLIGWDSVQRIVRNSTEIDDLDIHQLLCRLCALANMTVPELRQSTRIGVGATVGLWRPRIILNNHWRSWTEDERQAVLLHELAHQRRRDFAWILFGSWLRILFFFHPLVQLLVRRWRMEQELAADQLAAGWMNSAKAYGRALASLALRAQRSAALPAAVVTAEQVCIVRRVTMLKQGSLRPSRYHGRSVLVLVLLTVASLMPLSGLRGTPSPDDPLMVFL